MGGNGAALALLGAWVVRDLLALRRREEVEADLLGVVAVRRRAGADPGRDRGRRPDRRHRRRAWSGCCSALPLARLRER